MFYLIVFLGQVTAGSCAMPSSRLPHGLWVMDFREGR